MNPNSKNQMWSRWTFRVTPLINRRLYFEDVRATCARFGRFVFGSASEMNVIFDRGRWVIDVRTEGHPVHDAAFVENIRAQWVVFFEHNFGRGTEVALETKLEAGSRQDGTPAEQLIMMPSISLS